MTLPAKFEDRLRRVDSRQNARVKELRRAFAEATPNEQGEIAVEGMHLVEEAIRSGLRLSAVFFSESARERAHKLLPQLSSHTEALLLARRGFRQRRAQRNSAGRGRAGANETVRKSRRCLRLSQRCW